jgi:hypothetical protein
MGRMLLDGMEKVIMEVLDCFPTSLGLPAGTGRLRMKKSKLVWKYG